MKLIHQENEIRRASVGAQHAAPRLGKIDLFSSSPLFPTL